jgi:Lon protease-like protein
VIQRLPIFPLGTVLVPGEVLPLHLFEPRYLALVRDLLTLDGGSGGVGGVGGVGAASGREPGGSGSARFGVVAIRQGHEVGADNLGALYDVGCTAEVLEVDQRDDGTVDVVAVGRERFHLDRLVPDAGTPYLTGEVEWLEEPATAVDPDLAATVRRELAAYCARLGLSASDGSDGSGAAASPTLEDPTLLSYVVTGSVLLHLAERQALLAAPDASARLQLAARLLRRERLLWEVAPTVPAVDLERAPADPR